MRINKSALRATVRSVPFAVAATLVLSGCSSAPFARVGEYQRAQHDARMATLAQRNATETNAPPTQLTRPDERDYVASAAYWGAQVQANPDDVDAALNFSRNLRMMGGAAQAATVMKGVVLRAPNNGSALAEYGKALTAAERPDEAIGFLTQAIQMSPNDWSLLSARGVAHDQAGNHTAARADYSQALSIDPENSSVLTNLALSYVLAGQPAQAEPILRRVVARADATATMRQNLAMVLALQGKTEEAGALGRADLTAEDANNNVQLFTQFDSRDVTPAAPASAPKSQAVAEPEGPRQAVSAPATPALIAGDPMATPSTAIAVSAPRTAAPRSLQMKPVADDEVAPPAPAIAAVATAPKPKPVKKPVPKTAAAPAPSKATAAAPKAILSNGDQLITTINGIPVIGDAKPKGKPEAAVGGSLRGRSL
jgi:Flp pilus assembly protein TadD